MRSNNLDINHYSFCRKESVSLCFYLLVESDSHPVSFNILLIDTGATKLASNKYCLNQMISAQIINRIIR